MGSIDSIETLGLTDGPGIRTVVFLSGCKLRCKYCHNPEMWIKGKNNYKVDDLVKKILRNKPYYKRNSGGVTFSGGEPLLQSDFIIKVAKKLKKENIHIALDTAGVGNGNYEELLEYIDLIIFDVKHTNKRGYIEITGSDTNESINFVNTANKLNKKFWIRQVIIPGITDTKQYMRELKEFVKRVKNVEKIEFLPYHKLGKEKYEKLNIPYPYENIDEMDKEKCKKLLEEFKNTMN